MKHLRPQGLFRWTEQRGLWERDCTGRTDLWLLAPVSLRLLWQNKYGGCMSIGGCGGKG